ncbi:hypothetical protein GCM10027176_33650 [Actinoallomurus bryophytorum]
MILVEVWRGVDCEICTGDQKAFLPEHDASLGVFAWRVVSWGTAGRCGGPPNGSRSRLAVGRPLRPVSGEAGMTDRSSRPHARPRRTPTWTERPGAGPGFRSSGGSFTLRDCFVIP